MIIKNDTMLTRDEFNNLTKSNLFISAKSVLADSGEDFNEYVIKFNLFNLFNVKNFEQGTLKTETVNEQLKSIVSSSTNKVSEWIPVGSNAVYIIHCGGANVETTVHLCNNKEFLVSSAIAYRREVVFKTPDTCKKIMVTTRPDVFDSGEFQICKGENLLDGVSSQSGVKLTDGQVKDTTSTTVEDSNYKTTDWIPVENNTMYVLTCYSQSDAITIHCCNENNVLKVDARTVSKYVAFTTPTTCSKLRISSISTVFNSNDFLLSKAKTSSDYEEYVYMSKNDSFRIERYEEMLGDIETVLANVVGGI
jgi:hypothetical protein